MSPIVFVIAILACVALSGWLLAGAYHTWAEAPDEDSLSTPALVGAVVVAVVLLVLALWGAYRLTRRRGR